MGSCRKFVLVVALVAAPVLAWAGPLPSFARNAAPIQGVTITQGSAGVILVAQAQPPNAPPNAAPPPAAPPAPPAPAAAPPPLPKQQPVVYYVERNGKPFGPLTLQQVEAEIKAGRVSHNTLAWKTGDAKWTPVCQLPSLTDACGAMPPKLPASARWQHFIVGTWRYIVRNPENLQGVVQTNTTTYRPDGSFAGVTQTRMAGAPPVEIPSHGTWKVQAIGNGNEFTLTLNAAGSVQGRTATLRRINNNVVQNEDQGVMARRIGGY